MKKLGLTMLLCLFLAQVRAQDGVVFKIQYMPDRNYETTINVIVKLNADVTGDKNIIDKLKSLGITSPIDGNLAAGITGNMKTGSARSDNTFPMDMDFKVSSLNANVNEKDFPIPPEITEKEFKLKGRVTKDGRLQLDSAKGRAVSDSTAARIQHVVSLVQKEIKFPNKPLKPGDSFTDTIPIIIPVHGSYVQVNAKAIYKLVSISNGNAYFGVLPTFNVSFKMQDASVNITGMGIGRIVYDIKNNFPTSKESTMDIKIKVTSNKANIDGTSTVTSHYSCAINQ